MPVVWQNSFHMVVEFHHIIELIAPVALCALAINGRGDHTKNEEPLDKEQGHAYRCHAIWYLLTGLCAVLGFWFAASSFSMPRTDGALFVALPGIAFAAIGILGTARLARSRILLTDRSLEIQTGARRVLLRLEDIREVRFIGGQVALETGAKTRTTIPAIFRGWRDLYRRLRAIAAANSAQGAGSSPRG